jgi:SPP1 gp7 family putative phage head morphogenesis protein
MRPARVGPESRLLGRTEKTIDHAADRMATRLHRWLQRYARAESRRQIAAFESGAIARYVFAKAETPTMGQLERELFEILTDDTEKAVISSFRRTTGQRKVEITDRAMRDLMARKQIKLQQIMSTTRRAVTDSVRQIILTAINEVPRPTTNEIGRRIARVYHGDAGGTEIERVQAPLRGSRVLPTQRVKLDPKGNLYVFSFERAHLIARTEMNMAENTGIVEGYKATGVDGLKWLAYRDGRSRSLHKEMHGKITPIGVPFVLGDGTRMMHPGDPSAPIKHLANCRCTVSPVFE